MSESTVGRSYYFPLQKLEKVKPTRKPPTMEDISGKEKEVKALHQKIAQDEEDLALVQSKNKELLRRIEFMKRMQLTNDQDKQKLASQRSLSSSMDGRLDQNVCSEFKLQRCHTVESISIIGRDGPVEKPHDIDRIHELLQDDLVSENSEKGQTSEASDVETSTTQIPINEQDNGSEEEQMEIARELVKKNRRIFELEQVGEHSYAGFSGITQHMHLQKEKL